MPSTRITTGDLTRWGYVLQPNGEWAKPAAAAPPSGLAAQVAQPVEGRALDQGPPPRKGRKARTPRRDSPLWRVSLVAHLRREMDSDNLSAGLKPLRDAVADMIGVDDADHLIRWEYGQCQTGGREWVAVCVEEFNFRALEAR
jgi:hypothetical protein